MAVVCVPESILAGADSADDVPQPRLESVPGPEGAVSAMTMPNTQPRMAANPPPPLASAPGDGIDVDGTGERRRTVSP